MLPSSCGDSRPAWTPPGYRWAVHEVRPGGFVTIAWPPALSVEGVRPLALLVHGGGWSGGRPDEMVPVANLVSEFGYQPVLVQYGRLGEFASLDAALADLRTAWSYVVERAESIGGAAENSIVIGGSAGGHLATWAFAAHDGPTFRPSAVVLLCPVLDTSPQTGFGAERLGDDWRRWSLRHNPPRLTVPVRVLHGSEDEVVSPASTVAAVEALREKGGDVELTTVDGLAHGFYVRSSDLGRVRRDIEAWCGLSNHR